MFDALHLVFVYPDSIFFGWDAQILDRIWNNYLLIQSFISLLILGFFYFLTKPTPKANLIFTLFAFSAVVFGIITANLLINEAASHLYSNEGGTMQFEHYLTITVSAVVSGLMIHLIILIFYLILSQIPFMPYNLRGMRRYPISFIP